jgi:hypothetical protein
MDDSKQFKWDAAQSLVSTLLQIQHPYREQLKGIVARSSELLAPLGEPLLVESPFSKMLRREETYSDLLAWCLAQLALKATGRVLGIDFPGDGSSPETFEVRREYGVPYGNPGSSGRLDMRLVRNGRPIADVEVKLGHADTAELQKQIGYAKLGDWPRVLIARSGTQEIYEGEFRLRKWEDVCSALRHEARGLLGRGQGNPADIVGGALILAFAASVEEKLLGIPGDLLRAVFNRDAAIVLSGTGNEIRLLQKWISTEEGEGDV